MINYKPVSISNASFAFCRFSIAVLVWLSFILSSKEVLAVVCAVFLFSAIFKVKRAPMILLYDYTFQRFHPRKEVLVDQNSIFFAHMLGLALALTCFILVYTFPGSKIWYSVLAFAILKTVSALGFCPASKLYECTLNGNCCVNRKKDGRHSGC
jgi:hypothetical protein